MYMHEKKHATCLSSLDSKSNQPLVSASSHVTPCIWIMVQECINLNYKVIIWFHFKYFWFKINSSWPLLVFNPLQPIAFLKFILTPFTLNVLPSSAGWIHYWQSGLFSFLPFYCPLLLYLFPLFVSPLAHFLLTPPNSSSKSWATVVALATKSFTAWTVYWI